MVVSKEERSKRAGCDQLGIHKGDSDVAGAPGGREPLVVVREPPRVHESPALPWGSDGAVVAQEPTASTLEERKHQCPSGSWVLHPLPMWSRYCSLFSCNQGALGTAGCEVPVKPQPENDTEQRLVGQELWPWSWAALVTSLSFPFCKVGVNCTEL